MDTHLLDSIVAITDQRDMESLEFSLLAALAELLPVREITLNNFGKSFDISKPQSVLCYTLDERGEGSMYCSWDDIPRLVALDDRATHSLNTCTSEIFLADTDLYVTLIPIVIDQDAASLLVVTGDSEIADKLNVIEGMVKVYANYRYILNESSRDKLTGLLNRRTFDSQFLKLIDAQYKRKSAPQPLNAAQKPRVLHKDACPWLAIVDIDHFKNVNDTYGHVIGDEVVLLLSQVIKANFRDSDLLFRFGGEEFVVLLEPITKEMAHTVLNRFRVAISSFAFPQVGQVTVSIGFSRVKEGDFPTEVFGRADQSLYYVKKHGRNDVQEYGTLLTKGLLDDTNKTGSVELF